MLIKTVTNDKPLAQFADPNSVQSVHAQFPVTARNTIIVCFLDILALS